MGSPSICGSLRVDINREATFFVDQRIVCPFSSKLSRLFGVMSASDARNREVVFGDFPGGTESFELVSRFCYNHGKVEISPTNLALLHCAARYLEMRHPVLGVDNLVTQTRKALEGMKDWTWPDLMALLKHCQELNLATTLSGSSFLEKCLDSVVTRVSSSGEQSPSPSTSSSDSSGPRLSCETKSNITHTDSLKSSFSQGTWWFEDLLFVDATVLERLVHSMITQKFNHAVIGKFLLYYHKMKTQFVKPHEKFEIVDVVVDLLYILERASVSCKSLFGLLRMASTLGVDGCSRMKLELMIGSQLDQATLDNLLIPSPAGMNQLYDVDLVLRLSTAFLDKAHSRGSITELKKVAALLDSYLVEVAPDPWLRPTKFLALATSLLDSARDSNDNIYQAFSMYMEVHPGLSREDRAKMCGALNYDKKLSDEAYNPKFPSRNPMPAQISPIPVNIKSKTGESEPHRKQAVQHTGEPEMDNEKLQAQLQGMQSRVTELEKACKKMQNQMGKMPKARAGSSCNRSLPRLCS
ncbi:hypothetical protein MLD38_015791 [Melastoma candidum]|uniref:Uncharacterized protein n=1 Tax=Melastoma candidum TaxID=119954 RepID=A0ACB9RHD2_9MYRT|nr:hypothetical protein MLD38_015791 [Melastoma candidum]